jgi:1A family penicillin-binding protein
MAGKRTGVIFTAKKPRSKRKSSAPGFLVKTLETLGKPFYWLAYLLLYLFFDFLLLTPLMLRIIISKGKFLLRKISSIRIKIRIKIKPLRLKLILLKISFSFKKLILFVLIIFILFTFFFFLFTLKNLPDPNQLITRQPILTTKIYDRNGNLLYKIYRKENRTLVKLQELPLHLIQATVAIEDAEFYSHHGFSPKGIIRAALRNLKGDKLYGGSTITQQLVKNTLLSPERTLTRKIKEIILAVLVETKFSKDEILQMYLNEVGYGGAAYGIEEAAQMYFGKSAKNLSLAEAALLAGLPASPTRFSPFGAHPELAKERQILVLRRMKQEGFISEEEEKRAAAEELYFASPKTDIKAPHFVMYVKDLLVQKYGEQMVEEGGLEVKTTLDLEIQEFAQKVVSEEIKKLRSLKINNGAALVTKPATGEILAMVGSEDYFNLQNDGNVNVTLRPRQPGSAIKPIMYSLALENGFTAATIIPDTPITYKIPGQPPYSPKNYDNRFHGNVSLRIALASSYNVPAVKVLAALGVEKMIARGREMGITTWDEPSRFGLSLTLGGGEVKMVDLAVAYGVLANMGKKVDLNPILEMKNYKGEVLEKFEIRPPAGRAGNSKSETIFKPEIAYILTDILSDNSARAPAFGTHSWLNIPNHPSVAVKTGTTQNLRDNWTVGYTPDFLVAVWVGNNDNKPMSYVASGVTGASPIWNKIMSHLLAKIPDKKFPKPEGIVEVKICVPTGTLPCEGCPLVRPEIFIAGSEPKTHCLLSPSPTPLPNQ